MCSAMSPIYSSLLKCTTLEMKEQKFNFSLLYELNDK
jgi:hypothetical protein